MSISREKPMPVKSIVINYKFPGIGRYSIKREADGRFTRWYNGCRIGRPISRLSAAKASLVKEIVDHLFNKMDEIEEARDEIQATLNQREESGDWIEQYRVREAKES